MSLHPFVSTYLDGADSTLVKPSNWNQVHIEGLTNTNTALTLTTAHDFIAATGGAGGFAVNLPAVASVVAGTKYYIQKIDFAGGIVTVVPAGTDTIGGQSSSYYLENQGQYVEVVGDGVSNWIIKHSN